jgi:structural maintenance of chromosome 4
LIVARTAYRDNKSKYTINGRTSSYTEATTLLKDRGIDLTHKRFLILQVGPLGSLDGPMEAGGLTLLL